MMKTWRKILSWDVVPDGFAVGDKVKLAPGVDPDELGASYEEWLEGLTNLQYRRFIRSWPRIVGTVYGLDAIRGIETWYKVEWPGLEEVIMTGLPMSKQDLELVSRATSSLKLSWDVIPEELAVGSRVRIKEGVRELARTWRGNIVVPIGGEGTIIHDGRSDFGCWGVLWDGYPGPTMQPTHGWLVDEYNVEAI